MNINSKTVVICVLTFSLLFAGCKPEELFGDTVTPTPTITRTQTPTPNPTATQTPTPTLTPTPTQIGGGSGKVLFTYSKEGFDSAFPDLGGEQNVFISDMDGSNLVPVAEKLRGYNYIEAISPDGNKVLISSFTSWNRKNDSHGILYLFDLNSPNSEPVQIVQGFSQQSYNPAAGWIDDSRVVYLGKGEEGYGIYVVNTDGSDPKKIDVTIATPVSILAIDAERIYWDSDVRKKYASPNYGDYQTIWWTNIDGSDQGKLESNGRQIEYFIRQMEFSPDGDMIAWLPSAPEPACDTLEKLRELSYAGKYGETCLFLYLAELSNLDNPKKIPLVYKGDPSNDDYEPNKRFAINVSSIIWNPNSSEIFLLFQGRLSNGWRPPNLYTLSLSNSEVVLLDKFPSLHDYDMGDRLYGFWMAPATYGFSPDGRQIIFGKITDEETRKFILVNLESMALEGNFLNGLNHDALKSIYFLP